MKASIDQLVDKLERQVTRYREKRRTARRPRDNGSRRRRSDERPGRGGEPQIVKTKQFAVKPMSAEEAVLQLELIGHDFFVFRNAESGEINVVYRRRDGGYGLIEPRVGLAFWPFRAAGAVARAACCARRARGAPHAAARTRDRAQELQTPDFDEAGVGDRSRASHGAAPRSWDVVVSARRRYRRSRSRFVALADGTLLVTRSKGRRPRAAGRCGRDGASAAVPREARPARATTSGPLRPAAIEVVELHRTEGDEIELARRRRARAADVGRSARFRHDSGAGASAPARRCLRHTRPAPRRRRSGRSGVDPL